jgi:hypothetical protein
MRHTGQGLAPRPVVYRFPASSPVSPSIAIGVTISVENAASAGKGASWPSSAHAAHRNKERLRKARLVFIVAFLL